MTTFPHGYPDNGYPDNESPETRDAATFAAPAAAATDFGAATIAGYPATKPAATAPSPLYTVDGTQTGARKPPRRYSVTMLMLAASVLTAAVFGIIGTPGFVVAMVGIAPVVLLLAFIALVATRNT